MISNLIKKLNLEITPLVAYGLVLIAFFLGGGLLSKISLSAVEAQSRADRVSSELALLSTIQGTDIWQSRLKTSLEMRKAEKSRVLHGATAGVLAAEIQQSLEKIVKEFDLQSTQIKVNYEIENVQGVAVLLFSFSGEAADWAQMLDILFALLSGGNNMVVYEMSYAHARSSDSKSRFSLSGIVAVELDGGASNLEPSKEKVET